MSPDSVANESAIRVMVADNSRMYTRLLADALMRDPLLQVTPFQSSSSSLVAAVVAQDIDVLVASSDLDEHPSRGLEILHELRAKRGKTKSVLLLNSSQEELVLEGFRAGARGLFSKNDALEKLGECVRNVYQGQVWANSEALSIALEALANSPSVRALNANGMKLLSKRELQVVRCLAEGLTNREIAEELELSQHTVKNYLFRIFDKLGVSSRFELLFMTLSHDDALLYAPQQAPNRDSAAEFSHVDQEMLEKSAEAGIPAAQLALAQLYLQRRRSPQDLIQAYVWYVVATERALLTRGLITQMMTQDQIEEAKHQASIRLSKLNKNLPASSQSAAG